MKKSNKSKIIIIILSLIIVILIVALFSIIINYSKENKKSNNNNPVEEKNSNNQEKNLTLESKEVTELIKMLGKTEGSLTTPKNCSNGLDGIEVYLYNTANVVNSELDIFTILNLIFLNNNTVELKKTEETIPYYGYEYQIGYIINKEQLNLTLNKIFGNNLNTMPKNNETSIYFVNINGEKHVKYARYNSITETIEISLEDMPVGAEGGSYYFNNYDRIEQPSKDILELYEKVIYTNSIMESIENNSFKLCKDINCNQIIENNFKYYENNDYSIRFDEEAIKKYYDSFKEYKYTFTKEKDGKYHFQKIESTN